MISEEVIREVKAVVEPMKPELKDLSIKIHDNPELGLQEYKACEWQIEILHKYGFIVTENFCDIPTAYKAVYSGKKSGPKIAMLSEYDALPGIGHGCGHNLICMISIGSGIAMRKFADEYGAEIYVIGTPAEETEGAKVKMARLGVFKDVDVVMMSHPNYRNSSSVNFQALNARKVEFFGKSAHAAAAPEQGRSALEATISLFNMVDMSRQHISTDVRISGIIVDGGKAPNIVPEYASSIWYLRAAREATLDAVMDRFANICKAASLGTGTTVRVTPVEADFKDTVSNLYLSRLASTSMEELGVQMEWLGDQSIMGSSDVGDVSYECPTIQLNNSLGAFPVGKPYALHTKEVADRAISNEAFENAFTFIEGFTLTGYKLMTNPTHLKAIRKEFSKVKENII